jgi:hypothetical protein
MAELTTLEEKLAEVLGLAQASQGATEKVAGLVEDDGIADTLRQMREEAEETERRCTELADARDGKKTAILEKAQETKGEATEMMSTYLGGDADGLDGFEFLTMAEAGEVGHWSVLGEMAKATRNGQVRTLVNKHLPIQKRHFKDVQAGSLKLAREEAEEQAGASAASNGSGSSGSSSSRRGRTSTSRSRSSSGKSGSRKSTSRSRSSRSSG